MMRIAKKSRRVLLLLNFVFVALLSPFSAGTRPGEAAAASAPALFKFIETIIAANRGRSGYIFNSETTAIKRMTEKGKEFYRISLKNEPTYKGHFLDAHFYRKDENGNFLRYNGYVHTVDKAREDFNQIVLWTMISYLVERAEIAKGIQ